MEYFLRGLLPRILPIGFDLDRNCFIRPHEGNSHLKKSLLIKVKAFPYFPDPVKLIVIHDQDSNDCKKLKEELGNICSVLKAEDCLIRIACRELENWYLGDWASVEAAYPETKARQLVNKAKFRNPDSLNGSNEMDLLTRNFSKSHASRELGKIISLENNKSKSFNHLVSGISQLLKSCSE